MNKNVTAEEYSSSDDSVHRREAEAEAEKRRLQAKFGKARPLSPMSKLKARKHAKKAAQKIMAKVNTHAHTYAHTHTHTISHHPGWRL